MGPFSSEWVSVLRVNIPDSIVLFPEEEEKKNKKKIQQVRLSACFVWTRPQRHLPLGGGGTLQRDGGRQQQLVTTWVGPAGRHADKRSQALDRRLESVGLFFWISGQWWVWEELCVCVSRKKKEKTPQPQQAEERAARATAHQSESEQNAASRRSGKKNKKNESQQKKKNNAFWKCWKKKRGEKKGKESGVTGRREILPTEAPLSTPEIKSTRVEDQTVD